MRKMIVVFALFLAGVPFLITSPLADAKSDMPAYFAWYMYPITQAYHASKEFGEDLGTPQGTVITSLVSGRLVGAGFYGGGGVVTVRTTLNGAPADFYVQHLDKIVNVGLCQDGYCRGQYVYRGEVLGYSGGDCNWHYGPGFGSSMPVHLTILLAHTLKWGLTLPGMASGERTRIQAVTTIPIGLCWP